MSLLSFPGFSPTTPTACVAGDVLHLTAEDPAVASLIKYSVTSAPTGSTAEFSDDASIQLDTPGTYRLSATAGAATATFTVYCISRPAFDGLATSTAGATRSDEDRRLLLASLARTMTPRQADAWALGEFPSINLSNHGG